MAGLPTRFAKMGFARGWKAYKQSKIHRAPARKKMSMVRTMARRRFGRKMRYGRSKSGGLNLMTAVVTGLAYGVVRPQAEAMIQNNIPHFANGYEDEILIGGLAALGSWKGGGKIRQISNVVLAMESARVASSMGKTSTTSSMTGQSGPL